jgi:hypothetical protein
MSGQLDLSTKTIKIYGGAFDATARANIAAHLADLDNPHDVDKADVGLGNADNTSDANKPISTLTATALALKAPLASPALTGTPTAPTAAPGTVTTQIATTAFAQAAANVVAADVTALETELGVHEAANDNPHSVTKAQVGLANADNTSDANKPVSSATQTALNLKAPLANPTFTGVPAAPTAAPGTDTTQVATTAFVEAAADVVSTATASALALKAPLASPALTGVPAAPTAAPGTNTTQIATTAYTTAAVAIASAAAAAAQADADQALADAAPVPSLVAAAQTERPGDAVALYGTSKTGAPADATLIDPGWVIITAAGSVVRVDAATAADPQTVAPVPAFAVEAGYAYEIRWKVQRQIDPVDPLNDSVTLGIRWMQNDKTGVVSGGTTTVEDIALTVADGIQERITRIALTDDGEIAPDFVAPAGSIYFRPFVDLFGDSHVTDVIVIAANRVSFNTRSTAYRLEAPITGATITLIPSDAILIINPAAAIAALTVALPEGADKRMLRIATRQRIDALTITPGVGDAVDWITNELPQTGRLDFQFVESLSTWVQA